MRMSADRILTSHSGSLPRPDELIEANRAREATAQRPMSSVSKNSCDRRSWRWCDGSERRLASTFPAMARVRQVDGASGKLPRLVEL